MRHGNAGEMFFYDRNGVPTRLSAGENGQVLGFVNGIPTWVDAMNEVNTVLSVTNVEIESPDRLESGGSFAYLNATITPQEAASIIQIRVFIHSIRNISTALQLWIYRGTAPIILLQDAAVSDLQEFIVHDTPNTLDALTYSMRLRNSRETALNAASRDLQPRSELRLTEILVAS